MATIRWSVVLATFFSVLIKYEKNRSRIFGTLIIGGTLSWIVFMFIWPMGLLDNKLRYFVYPDKSSQEFFTKLYDRYKNPHDA